MSDDYQLTINLLDKQNPLVTSLLDLTPFFAKIEATHTGIQKTNNCLLTLYIPPNGQFVRTTPLLMDETTKELYMIEVQINQGANTGQVFRCEIGQPTAKSDKDLGEIIEIPLVAQEFTTKESYGSFHDTFATPQDHFIKIINNYDINSGIVGDGVAILPIPGIFLPDSDVLKQNWLPLAPTPTGSLFEEVIDRLAEAPTQGGTLTDYYYDFNADPFSTRTQNMVALEFGLIDSGVVINPTTLGQVGAESGNTFNLDNLVYKNVVILKGDPNKGSLPHAHQVFASRYLHALERPVWNVGTTYETGDVVQVVVAGFPQQRFYTSLVDSNLGNNPTISPGQWDEDFTIDPNDPNFFTYTPWTNSLDLQGANLAGKSSPSLPLGYAGFMVDWNLSRFDFDRNIPDDRFERVSFKLVDQRLNNPPGTQLWNGKRFIVGIFGSTNGDIGGAWAGHRGQIAEAVIDENLFLDWKFSNSPIDVGAGSNRQQDMVMLWEDAYVMAWSASASGGIGDWIVQWDVSFDYTQSAGSCFHPVKNLGLVTGATGIPLQAIEATYNWKDQGNLTNFVAPAPHGNPVNLASRGAWLSFMFPYPRENTIAGGKGSQYGEDAPFPYLDTFNLTRNHIGQVGWNFGVGSEDLGSISSVSFKLKLALYISEDDSQLLDGFSGEPMIFWALDRNDRIYFQDFTQRVNNAWELHTIPVGPRAPQSLYNSRIDELASVFNHKLPNFDFFLSEREFNGVLFNWRQLKAFGVFMKNSYDGQGLYTGPYDEWFKQMTQALQQTWHNALRSIDLAFKGEEQRDATFFITDHSKIAMDELRFDKELYVTSTETSGQNAEPNPRMILERDETLVDYDDAKAKARAILARKQFFPQFWFIQARGDVRMKLGQEFTLDGPRVPGAPLKLVCSQVKHRIDSDGYQMEVFGIRKFVLP